MSIYSLFSLKTITAEVSYVLDFMEINAVDIKSLFSNGHRFLLIYLLWRRVIIVSYLYTTNALGR